MRTLEAVTPRVETGPIRFGKDWPGLFIRGDEALGLQMEIDAASDYLTDQQWEIRALINRLSDLLGSCSIDPSGATNVVRTPDT